MLRSSMLMAVAFVTLPGVRVEADQWRMFHCLVVPQVAVNQCDEAAGLLSFDSRDACNAYIDVRHIVKFQRYTTADGTYYAGNKCMGYTSPWHD